MVFSAVVSLLLLLSTTQFVTDIYIDCPEGIDKKVLQEELEECGLKPGVFMHVVENLHIYDRHIEQVNELLSREPSHKQPKLILKEGKTNFYDFTIDDFELIDYEPVKPQLKFELGI